MNKNLLVFFFSLILLFLSNSIKSQELLDEFSETIDKINQDLDSLPSSSIEESIVIDKAIDEISSVINLVEESLNKDDAESAIKILEIMDHAISDISSIVPDEVYSDMSEMKLDNFNEDQMKEIQIITESMNENKQENMESLIGIMVDLNKDGFNTFELINNLNDIGVDTIEVNVVLPNQDEIVNWDKKQWANSYHGSLLITNDDSIITDKELEDEVVKLENLFNKNAQQIETQKASLFDFETKLSSLNEKLLTLKNEKEVLVTEFNNLENVSSLSKEEYEKNLELLNVKIDQYNDDLISMNKSIDTLKTDINELEDLKPELNSKLIRVSESLDVVTDAKANLAIASAQKYGLNVNSDIIESVETLQNKSIITLDGSSLFRIVDTEALLDNKGEFSIPKGTLSVKGQVYTAGAVRPEKLFSFYDLNENNNSFQISFTQNAQDLISKNSSLQGGKQDIQDNVIGSWVLVNAATGEQMSNPLTGHRGSIVCEKSTCGINGDFGKQAASFGGMYVLENLADKNGNVSGLCNDGDCKFNVETLVVLGKNNIENNIFNENGEGLYQDDFTTRQLNEVKSFGITSEQRINAVKYAEENNIKIDALNIPGVTEDSINTQRLAVEFAKENNVSISEIKEVEGSYAKFHTNDFKDAITSTMTYSGETLSGGTSEIASQTFKVIDGQVVKKTSEEVSRSIESANEAINEVAQEAAVQVAEVAKEVAEVAQEAAQEIAETASTVITGDDIEALSELANDALGSWVLVDAKTGKQMVNPISGHSGGSVCTASVCGAGGSFGEAAAAFGGVYVLESLADPETGNVASGCNSGDCQFDIGN